MHLFLIKTQKNKTLINLNYLKNNNNKIQYTFYPMPSLMNGRLVLFVTLKQLSMQVPQEDLTGRLLVHELDHVGIWPSEVTGHGLMFEANSVKV